MPDNISKYNEALTPEERAERGRKAGARSGEIRRENRRLKDAIIDRITDDDLNEIVDALIKRAKRSNRDFIVLRDTLGQRPTNNMSIEHDEPIIIRFHSVPPPGEPWEKDDDGGE